MSIQTEETFITFLNMVSILTFECRILLGILQVGHQNYVEPRPGGLPAMVQHGFQDPLKFMLDP